MNAAIVLAAGQSRRFGLANKLTQPVAGIPLVARTVERILAGTQGPVVLVLGRRSRPMIRALARRRLLGSRLRLCRNPHPERDMGYSLALGLSALPQCASVVTIHLADMPSVDCHLMRRLQQALPCSIDSVRPVYRGQPGHPVLVRQHLLNPTMLAAGSRAKTLLAAVPADKRIRINGPASCVQDIDTRRMRRNLIRRDRSVQRTTTP